jgi:hypothetical protein
MEVSRSSASGVVFTPIGQFRTVKSTCLYRRLEQVWARKYGSTRAQNDFFADMERTILWMRTLRTECLQ